MNKNIETAIDSLSFALSDLNQALGKCSSVESIILLQLTEGVAKARHKTQAFLNAISVEEQ